MADVMGYLFCECDDVSGIDDQGAARGQEVPKGCEADLIT
jgi:hypothetical protein